MQFSSVRLTQVFIAVASLLPGLALASTGTQDEQALAREQDFSSQSLNVIDNPTFFVTQIYVDLLNRVPTQPELSNGVSALSLCNSDASCLKERQVYVAQNVFESPEHYTAQGLNPFDGSFQMKYVMRCYTGFMRRPADAVGLNFWYNDLLKTGSYMSVIRGFVNSPEYRSRFGSN